MKHNIFSKALLIAATAGLALSACSPEDFDGVSEAGLPLAENAKDCQRRRRDQHSNLQYGGRRHLPHVVHSC
jgi:hypothetical protein